MNLETKPTAHRANNNGPPLMNVKIGSQGRYVRQLRVVAPLAELKPASGKAGMSQHSWGLTATNTRYPNRTAKRPPDPTNGRGGTIQNLQARQNPGLCGEILKTKSANSTRTGLIQFERRLRSVLRRCVFVSHLITKRTKKHTPQWGACISLEKR